MKSWGFLGGSLLSHILSPTHKGVEMGAALMLQLGCRAGLIKRPDKQGSSCGPGVFLPAFHLSEFC